MELWQMSRAQFVSWAAVHHPNRLIRASARSRNATVQGHIDAINVASVRADVVLQAVLAGKPVPDEVLRDYPYLRTRVRRERMDDDGQMLLFETAAA